MKAPALAPGHRKQLLALAHATLDHYVRNGVRDIPASNDLVLRQRGAAFVTLRRRDGALRGCRGEIEAQRPLIASVAEMTIAAASDDPRFPAVEPDELPHITIEINALSELEVIVAEDVVVGRHGLVATDSARTGLLLPDVPLEYGWSREEFLEHTCTKAGFASGAWRHDGMQLLAFETQSWGDPPNT